VRPQKKKKKEKKKKKKRGRRADKRRCGEAPQLARLPMPFLCFSYVFPMSFLGSRLFVSLGLVPFFVGPIFIAALSAGDDG
jgi:hypothetical protein